MRKRMLLACCLVLAATTCAPRRAGERTTDQGAPANSLPTATPSPTYLTAAAVRQANLHATQTAAPNRSLNPMPTLTPWTPDATVLAARESWSAASAARMADVHATQTARPGRARIVTLAPSTRTLDEGSPFDRCVQSGQGVRYVVTGSGVDRVSLTWTNDTSGTEQGDYRLPVCKSYPGFTSRDFLYISAQISEPTSGAGSIRVRIYDGDSVIAEASASGFASIASCRGTKQ